MKLEIQRLSNGTILINGYLGYLSTTQAVEAVKEAYEVEITLDEWEVESHRFKIGPELISSFSFRPKKGLLLGII